MKHDMLFLICWIVRNCLEIPIEIMKIMPMVEYDGHQISKATLVSQLNANMFLSNDKLTRVKDSIYFNNNDNYISTSSSPTSMMVGLGYDVGVFHCV